MPGPLVEPPVPNGQLWLSPGLRVPIDQLVPGGRESVAVQPNASPSGSFTVKCTKYETLPALAAARDETRGGRLAVGGGPVVNAISSVNVPKLVVTVAFPSHWQPAAP